MKQKSKKLLYVILFFSLLAAITTFCYVKYDYIHSLESSIYPSANQSQYADGNVTRAIKGDKPIVLFLGDSRIMQWSPMPGMKEYEFLFAGRYGETSGQLLLRFENVVDAVKPDTVVLQTGINDLKAIGVMPDRENEIKDLVRGNILKIIGKLESKGIKVVLLSVFPAGEVGLLRRFIWSDAINDAVKDINIYFNSVHSSGFVMINCDDLFFEKGLMNSKYEKDTLHINQQAYIQLNRLITAKLSERF